MRWSPIIAGFLTLASPAAIGAEGEADGKQERHEIRFGMDNYDDKYRLTLNTPLGSGESDQHWNDDNAFWVGYYTRIPFVSLGFVGAFRSSEDQLPGISLNQTSFMGRIEGGLGISLLGPLLRFELMPYAGLGDGRLEVATLFGDDVTHDLITEYGAHLDAISRIGPVEGGLGVGWAKSQVHYDVGLNGNTGRSRVDIEQSGFLWRAILGVVF
jgi:hypothetical protein